MKNLFYHFVVMVMLCSFLSCTKKEVLTPQTIVIQDSVSNLAKSLEALKGSWIGYMAGPNFQSGANDSLNLNLKSDGIVEAYVFNQKSIGKWCIKDVSIVFTLPYYDSYYEGNMHTLTLKGYKESNSLQGFIYNGAISYGDVFFLEKQNTTAY